MLNSISLKFSASPSLELPLQGISVFVGPNNSGKSLVLREIEQAMLTHPFPSNLKILKDYEVKWYSLKEEQEIIKKIQLPNRADVPEGYVRVGRIDPNGGFQEARLCLQSLRNYSSSRSDKRWYATQFLRFGVIRLDGRSRFNLTNDQTAGDLLGVPSNLVAKLFVDESSRKEARRLIEDAFNVRLVIDPTNLGTLRLRLSQEKVLSDEQSLNERARQFHARATYIKDASDGVQAYVGIVSAVVSGEYHTILIDEPEAFLHPPLARKLGRHLAQLATSRNGSLLASTHSSDFLMGCIQGSAAVRVVRLEYQNGQSKGRLVDSEDLRKLFQNPLMRSANAISALFYDGVIITESDNDRVFYSELYLRLMEVDSGIPSILFINAQNKQTIKDILKPLRQFGVPAAAITDLDVVKDGGAVWRQWLEALQIPDPLKASYQVTRDSVLKMFESVEGKEMKRDGGIAILPDASRQAAEEFISNINAYGLFPVRTGELESWLPHLGVRGSKTTWAIRMLERLGSDPSDPSYVRPANDDAWAFLRDVIEWIRNPTRKGMAP